MKLRLVCLGVMGWATLAFGQSVHTQGSTLLINEYPVFSIKTSLDRWSIEKRIQGIYDTLRKDGIKEPISLKAQGNDVWINGATARIVRISPAEAAAHGTSVSQLAAEWKGNIEQALRIPSLYLPQNPIFMAEGATQEVPLMGSLARSAEVSIQADPGLRVRRANQKLIVTALQPGDAEVRLSVGPLQTVLEVSVKEAAAQFPTELSAEVMGDPATAKEVMAAAQTAVRNFFSSNSNLQVEILETAALPISRGAQKKIKVLVRLSAEEKAPVEGEVTVNVVNREVQVPRETSLWYSNYPESVTQTGVLFHRYLNSGESTRLLYHHANATLSPMGIQVAVYNLSTLPAKLALMLGDGQPHTDPVRVGLDAGETFLKHRLEGRFEIVEVPPRSILYVAANRLNPGETMSGLGTLSMLSTGPRRLLVRTEAVSVAELGPNGTRASIESGDRAAYSVRPFVVNPPETTESSAVFSEPFRQLDIDYSVGGRMAQLRIGEQAIPHLSGEGQLNGNYGVLYTANFNLSNPNPDPATIVIEFEASAGYSAFLMALQGHLRRLPVIQTKQVLRLETIRMAPMEQKSLKLQTLPLSGSSYPATVTVKSLPNARPRPGDGTN